MKATVIEKFGEPDVFNYASVDTPEPKEDEVRIKILATGINRLDHYLRRIYGKSKPRSQFSAYFRLGCCRCSRQKRSRIKAFSSRRKGNSSAWISDRDSRSRLRSDGCST